MNLIQLLAECFHSGDFFVAHWSTCEGQELYTVEVEDGTRLFEITQHNYEHIRQEHPNEVVDRLDCGCVCRTIVPNSVKQEKAVFSLN